jgi:hypothetical protein
MKVLVETKEVQEEGFLCLLGKDVIIFGGAYIYAGKLVGVNQTCVKLENPHIVYETGPWTGKKFKDAQSLGKQFHYVCLPVESFGETTQL